MASSKKQILQLQKKVDEATEGLQIAKKSTELENLVKKMARSDFWDDPSSARRQHKRRAKLEKQVAPWVSLQERIGELHELVGLGDESLFGEIDGQYKLLEKEYLVLEDSLKFSAPYDDYGAVVSIMAGAGGTDAQDWAQMLQRMYFRWAEKSDVKIGLIDESKGEVAGIKNTVFSVNGENVYGRLKAEHGVHRLVRKSPFNSAASRETSFAMVEVLPQIEEPKEVEIAEDDLKIDTFRASGHGGQSVNTTDSAVRVTHLPTNIVVSIQNEKSQIQNRETAMKILRSRLTQLRLEQQKEKISQLKGPNKEVAFGNQIRNYVLHPYTLVKDSRSGFETTDVDSILDGNLSELIDAGLSIG